MTRVDRILAVIRHDGLATSEAISQHTGLGRNNLSRLMAPHVEAGTLSVESAISGAGRRCRAYRWIGEGKPAPASASSPKQRATRACLSCGGKFDSNSAGNRICPRCAKANERAGNTPFDTPAVIRYR